MALHEVTFPSHNGRDEIHAWIYSPVRPARGIVQIAHGYASRYPDDLTALVLCGIAAVMHGIEETLDRDGLAAAIAGGHGSILGPDQGRPPR